MSRLWINAASSAALMAAVGLMGGLAFGAPPQGAGKDDLRAKGVAKEEARDAIDTAKNTARDAKDTSRDTARDKQQGTNNPARETAKETVHPEASKSVRDTGRNAKDSASDQREATPEKHQGHRSTSELGLNLGRMSEHGVTVGNLASSSVMYRAGLRERDYIVSINGHRLTGPGDFDRWAYAGGRHDRVTCIVWRDGREEVVYFEPTVLYVEESVDEERPYFGIAFDDRYANRIVIRRVYPDSPAFVAGLRAGDEITTWNGQRVGSPSDFSAIIQRIEPGTVNFEYLRDSKQARGEARFNRR